MSVAHLNVVNATIRSMLELFDSSKYGSADKEKMLKMIDELENQVDNLLTNLAPERITDERFSVATKALKELAEKFKLLREYVVSERYVHAKKQLIDIQESIRHLFRLMIMIKAGAPVPFIFQVAPQFLREIPAPENLLYSNPLAAQIYNVLIRRGEASVEELALELKIDDNTRDQFNMAISQLINNGYVRAYFTPDNKLVLKPAR